MLDNEPTGEPTEQTSAAADSITPAEPSAPPRRRRATRATAAPAESAAPATDRAAPSPDSATAPAASADSPTSTEPPAPAKKATRSRAKKAAPAVAAATGGPAQSARTAETDSAGTDPVASTSPDAPAPAVPAKKATRSRAKKAAPAAAPTVGDAGFGGSAADEAVAPMAAAPMSADEAVAPMAAAPMSADEAVAPMAAAPMSADEAVAPMAAGGAVPPVPSAAETPLAATGPAPRKRARKAVAKTTTTGAPEPVVADVALADIVVSDVVSTDDDLANVDRPAGAGAAAGSVVDESLLLASPAPRAGRRPATTIAPPPAVMFMPPVVDAAPAERDESSGPGEPVDEPPTRGRRTRKRAADAVADDIAAPSEEPPAPRKRTRRSAAAATAEDTASAEVAPPLSQAGDPAEDDGGGAQGDDVEDDADRPRRRRGRRGRGRGQSGEADPGAEDNSSQTEDAAGPDAGVARDETEDPADDQGEGSGTRRRRRRRRRGSDGVDEDTTAAAPRARERGSDRPERGDRTERADRPERTERGDRAERAERGGERGSERAMDDVQGVRGSTRLEAKRQRRRDGRDQGRRRTPILSEAEFLARREAVERVMAVRQTGDRTQIAVLEDDVLVEHYVTKASATSFAGNVYLGRVQNVLSSMEAAFVDIGKSRNAVLYAGEVNWDAAGIAGKSRSIEHALKSGDPVLVQVSKDPIGQKGARLTSQISLPGRYLVYVPNGSMTGISRKLPDTERQRLKDILKKIVPEGAGVIIRTAAEGASEEELTRDVNRLAASWQVIQERSQEQSGNAPTLLYEEPDLAIRVVRDVFNEDFSKLVVSGDEVWDTLEGYVSHVAPDLADRLSQYDGDDDIFADLRVDEQLAKALDRKVHLPSGGSLVIDRTEAMTVIDVNTGKFIGSGGNLEQTVTRNNLEAAEEIVRQLRLRDVGGIIVIDFIDMVLEANRDLVLRRLTECLGRDRTKHQVAEVTSLGLVQMTRKRVGQGLLEAFSEPCEHCNGRGIIVHSEPVDESRRRTANRPAAKTARPEVASRTQGPAAVAAASAAGTTAASAAPVTPSVAPAEDASVEQMDPAPDRPARRGRRRATAPEVRVVAEAAPEVAVVAGAAPEVPAVAEAAPENVAVAEATPEDMAQASNDLPPEAVAEPTPDVVQPDAAPDVVQPDAAPDVVQPDAAPDVTEPEPAPDPAESSSEPDLTPVAAEVTEPAPRRRRRAASRPAGPPALV